MSNFKFQMSNIKSVQNILNMDKKVEKEDLIKEIYKLIQTNPLVINRR